MAAQLDGQVAAFSGRPLDAGPYAIVRLDALTQKVRGNGRVVNVHALVALRVNGDDAGRSSASAGWLAFLCSLMARGLTGVRLVISDAHREPVETIGAALGDGRYRDAGGSC